MRLKISRSTVLVAPMTALFILFATRTEFPSLGPSGPGVSYLLRSAASLSLLALLVALHRRSFRVHSLTITFTIVIIFIISNLAAPSNIAMLGAFLIFSGLALAITSTSNLRPIHISLVKVYLFINVAGLLLSASLFYGGGYAYDFHAAMFPWSSARQAEFMGLFRLTGFQIEPGTYANIIFLMVICLALLTRELGTPIQFIAIMSTLVTFSAWSVIAVCSYLVAISYQTAQRVITPKRLSITLVVFAFLVGGAAFLFHWSPAAPYIDYFLSRLQTTSTVGSMSLKVNAWSAWQSHFPLDMIVPQAVSDSFCPTCKSPQDLGTGINMIYYLGLPLSAVFFGWLAYKMVGSYGTAFLIAAAPVVVSKFYYFDPALWYLFGLIMFAHQPSIRRLEPITKPLTDWTNRELQ